jgi:hypothetical protein
MARDSQNERCNENLVALRRRRARKIAGNFDRGYRSLRSLNPRLIWSDPVKCDNAVLLFSNFFGLGSSSHGVNTLHQGTKTESEFGDD